MCLIANEFKMEDIDCTSVVGSWSVVDFEVVESVSSWTIDTAEVEKYWAVFNRVVRVTFRGNISNHDSVCPRGVFVETRVSKA